MKKKLKWKRDKSQRHGTFVRSALQENVSPAKKRKGDVLDGPKEKRAKEDIPPVMDVAVSSNDAPLHLQSAAEVLLMLSQPFRASPQRKITPKKNRTPVFQPKRYPWELVIPSRKMKCTSRRLENLFEDLNDTVLDDNKMNRRSKESGKSEEISSDDTHDRPSCNDKPTSPPSKFTTACEGTISPICSYPPEDSCSGGLISMDGHFEPISAFHSSAPDSVSRSQSLQEHFTTSKEPTSNDTLSQFEVNEEDVLVTQNSNEKDKSPPLYRDIGMQYAGAGSPSTRNVEVQCKVLTRDVEVQCDLPIICYAKCKLRSDFQFYTGITAETFEEIYAFVGGDEVCCYLKYTNIDGTPRLAKRSVLSPKDRLFMTLLRLRRGIPIRDLAALFHITQGFASTIVYTWVRFLSQQFQVLLDNMFVGTAAQNANKLSVFKPYPNLRAIIDCAEFKIQKSYNFQMQSNTWSSYKSDNTLKYLFAMSCYTGASFVSKGYEGSMSDKEVVMASGFLDHLKPGDKIMCDRGFDIEPELNERGVDIVIPAFLGTREALTAPEIRESAQISGGRIFVEILIKRVKDYRILRGKIPNKLLPVMDDMIKVCTVFSQFDKPFAGEEITLDSFVSSDIE